MLKLFRTRTLLLSVMGLAVIGAAIGAGTFAFFAGTATSENNTFAAGTLSLALTDDNETVPEPGLSIMPTYDHIPRRVSF